MKIRKQYVGMALLLAALAGGGTAVADESKGLAACLLQQNPAACAEAFPALADQLSECPPSEAGFNCAFNAVHDFLGGEALVAFLREALAVCNAAPANAACAALRDTGGAPDRLAVLSEQVARGALVYTEAGTLTPAAKTIDGNPADWQGQSARIGGSQILQAGEHIYTDYLFDAFGADDGDDARRMAALLLLGQVNNRTERVDALQQAAGDQLDVPQPAGSRADHYGDATNREDGLDLTELRWAADADNLFLLARVAKLMDGNNLTLIVLADTQDGVSGMNGLNAGLSTGIFDRALVMSGAEYRAIDLTTGESSPIWGMRDIRTNGYDNALEARLPRALLQRADGTLRVAAFTARRNADGSYTPANLAYRFGEPVTIYNERLQGLALFAGSVDGFAASIRLADLTAGRTQIARPGAGYHERQFVSGENISVENDPENGRLQPYGLYVPTGFTPAPQAMPLTFWLHYRGGKAHSGAAWTPRLIHQLGEEQNNLVVTPRARGTSTWYTTRAHQDFFEVFADVAGTGLLNQYAAENLPAGHGFASTGLFVIDRSRVYLSGYSMGGFATYLFGGLYPDLFAAGYSTSGAVTQGAWTGLGPDDGFCGQGGSVPGVGAATPCFVEANNGRANAQLNYRILENTRHLPLVIHHGTNDELALTPGAVRMGQRLLELGYRHDMTLFLGYEHFTQAIVDEWADGAFYLNQFRAPQNPRQVTYKVVPALVKATNEVQLAGVNGNQPFAFNPDGAYWVDGLVVREGADGSDPRRFGQIDAESLRLPGQRHIAVPRTGVSASPPYLSTPVFSPGNHSTPYVRSGLDWVALGDEPTGDNRFTATLTNLSAATLDLARMAIDLGARADGVITSDGPVTLTLRNVTSPVRVYVNEFERPGALQGNRIVLALGAEDLRGGVALVQLQPGAALALDADPRPDLVAACRSAGPQLAPLCDAMAAAEAQLVGACEGVLGEGAGFCGLFGGHLYGLVDACRETQPNFFCKVADTFLEGFASSCRQIPGASPDFCALLSKERIADDEIEQFEQGWTHRALALQYELGAPLAFVDALFPATHNSFNSTNANNPQTLSGSDANQRYSSVAQLRLGIRALELDLHWMPRADGSGFGPTVCHGNAFHFGCSYEKGLRAELEEIRGWLDEHPDQVIVLYLENNMNEPLDGPSAALLGREPYAVTAGILQEVFGTRLYTPADHAAFLGRSFACGNGHPLEAGVEALRARGKQLYIHTEGCDAGWAALVFNKEAGGRHSQGPNESQLTTFSESGMCGGFDRATHRTRWTRYFEDGTLVGAATGLSDSDFGSTEEFRGMVRCGVNMPSLDHVTPNDPRLAAFVWSWETGQPSQSSAANCALHTADHRFRAADCALPRPYACAKVLDTNAVGSRRLGWAIAQPAGAGRTPPVCPAGYRFDVPRNGFENELLRIAKENAGVSEVWLNYSDIADEGEWRVPELPALDTDPEPFGFTSVSGVSRNTVVSSNVVTIQGLGDGVQAPISVSGDPASAGHQYRIDGGAWTSASGSITNGQTVQVRHVSASAANSVTETVLTIGGVQGKFRSTTAAGADTDPDAFTFGTKTNVAAGVKVASDPIVPVGYDAGLVKPGAGTEYKLDCTLANANEESGWTTAQQTITQGQSICVRHTTASAPNTLRKTSLQIGRTVGYFTTRTAP
jgi:S-formylglutathione hydrolase FrmB